jgi:TIR domain
MQKKLWISYSRKDNTDGDVDFIAGELRKREIEPRLDCFVISAGLRLWPQIEKEITDPNQSNAWAIFLTQNSLTSEAVLEEIGFAVDRALSTRGGSFPVIGINRGDVDRALIPASLRTRLYVDLTDDDWAERIAAAVEGRAPRLDTREILPIFFNASMLDGIRVIEARPRAGRWFPAFIAVLDKETHNLGQVMQNPSGHPSFTGSITHSSFTYENGEGRWLGTVVHHNITPINSIYFELKGPISQVLVGSLDGDRLGVTYAYRPR